LQTTRLRLLATTDVHLHLLGYDYYTDRSAPGTGLEHTATLIAEARREAPGALLFDNGDFLQGSPLGDCVLHGGIATPDPVHPAIRVMNRIGYDAATLGNHEFNHGLDALFAALRGATFPVVTANVARHQGVRPEADDTLLPPWCLLRRNLPDAAGQLRPLIVGVIGFAPPQIVQWDRNLLAGTLSTRGIVETAMALIPRLRAVGADVVVALSHSGLGPVDAGPDAENASTALARVPGIDAIVAGHSHLPFPAPGPAEPGIDLECGTVFGVPVVQPGAYGSHLGVIDLDLTHDGQRWRVTGGQAELRGINSAVPAAPEIAETIGPDHTATLAWIRRPVGYSARRLHSHFATIAPSDALRIVAEAQAAFVAQQLQGRPEAALPVLSAVSPFKAGGRGGAQNYIDIPAGELALHHVAGLHIFPNTIAALRLSGAEITEWLENAAGLFHHVLPGSRDAPLIDKDFPSYNHDRILGLGFRVDLRQPARYDRYGALVQPEARRIRDLRWNGRPLDPRQEFILATNSYRAAGSGGYVWARPSRLVDVGRTSIRDLLIRHVAEGHRPAPPAAPDFGFVPMPGTSVIYDTSPEAMAHLAEIAHLAPEYLGPTPSGFARLRLHP
jgi:2',3'-cyclic-nucleotide 2'-phosphodiesterase/3'-nucleotidase